MKFFFLFLPFCLLFVDWNPIFNYIFMCYIHHSIYIYIYFIGKYIYYFKSVFSLFVVFVVNYYYFHASLKCWSLLPLSYEEISGKLSINNWWFFYVIIIFLSFSLLPINNKKKFFFSLSLPLSINTTQFNFINYIYIISYRYWKKIEN